MSVPFFIGEERLKTKIGKIGLASAFLLGLIVNQVAANEAEVKASSEESSVQASSSKVEEKKSETTTSQKEEEKKVETSSSQRSEKKEEVKETRASSQKEESKPNSTSAHWEGDFYVKADGSKAKSEWIFDTTYNSWFYMKVDGRYAQKEWHGNYYLKAGGYMAKNEWLYDPAYSSYFYLKADGSYANEQWQKIDGKWYYFKKWGYMAQDEWQGNYYLTESGAMATGELIMDDTRYTFADSGELKEKKALNVGWVYRNGHRYFFNHREEQVGTDQVKKVIDVSEHNGHISDWKKVIDDNGVDGVIVRLGYSGTEDKELAYNIKELNRLGIPYGVYLYTYAENETDAENDANQTIELLKKYKMNLSYPIYYDVENWEYVNKTKRASNDTGIWVKIINKYMATMKQAGYQNVKVYSYRQLLQTRLNHPDILQHVNWVAAYTDALDWNNPHYSGEKGWQYTSSDSLKGIRGRVDVSVWY